MAGLTGAALRGGFFGRNRIKSAFMGPPGPVAGQFSPSPYRGSIPMVAQGNMERRATYRAVYLTNPWVYSAVNKKAADVARCALHVFGLQDDGSRVRIRSDLPMDAGRL